MTDKNRNQGEGNVDASRRYNKSSEEFAESGEVKKHESERRSTSERKRDELKQAEDKAKERIAETDPNVSKNFDKPAGS